MSKFAPTRAVFTLTALLSLFPLLSDCWVIRDPEPRPYRGYTLAWSDDFNGPDGSSPDLKKWSYDIGGNGWGNNELEYYTNRTQNAQIKGGNLVITAQQEAYTGADGVSRNYTSARLKTQGLFSQAYGRFEARIKIPAGQGMWPAFWMLGNDITSVGWPKCGRAISPPRLVCRPVRTLPAIFTFMLSSGNPARSAFTWIPISTPRLPLPSGLRAAPGFSTTPSLSSSTSRSAAVGRARLTAQPSSRSKCSLTMSASTPSNSSVARRFGGHGFLRGRKKIEGASAVKLLRPLLTEP